MAKLISTRTRIADLGKPRIIIIGGGFAGLEVVKGFKKYKVQVVLFDRYNHHTFQPLLYQVATSGLETSSIVFPFRKRFARRQDFYFRLGEVISVKPEENYIETSIGGVKYDYLIIANGAGTNYYGMADVEHHALPMKTVIDSIKLRNHILRNLETALLTEDNELMNSLIDYVIVGGGPTGVELAGALAELRAHVFPKDYRELSVDQMDIHLIEATPRLLNGMSDKSSQRALNYLRKMGVKVHLNLAVKSYDGYTVTFSNGTSLISRTLIWAAGVKGKPIKGIQAESVAKNGRILVDEFNRVNGHGNIFAIGDAAVMEGDPAYPRGHPMMAPPAQQQGLLVTDNIHRLITGQPLKAFRYRDKGSMATIGRNRAVADLGKLRLRGTTAWLVWMFVHVMSLVGTKNKFFVTLDWLWSYFSYDKSNRIIISRPKDLAEN